MVIGYIRKDKYIITIEDILDGKYSVSENVYPKELLGVHKSCTNNFKIIFIEDIFGNSYESINIDVRTT